MESPKGKQRDSHRDKVDNDAKTPPSMGSTSKPTKSTYKFTLPENHLIQHKQKNIELKKPKDEHWPYVRILVRGVKLVNLTIRTGRVYIRCFVESGSPKATPSQRYFYESPTFTLWFGKEPESKGTDKKETDTTLTCPFPWDSQENTDAIQIRNEPCPFLWEANVRLGEVARVQVWQKTIIGDDIFLGELADDRIYKNTKYMSYNFLTDQIPDQNKPYKLYAIESKYKNLKNTLKNYEKPPGLKIDYQIIKPREGLKKWLNFLIPKGHAPLSEEDVKDTIKILNIKTEDIEFEKHDEFDVDLVKIFKYNKLRKNRSEEVAILSIIGNNYFPDKDEWKFFEKTDTISINRWAKFFRYVQKEEVNIQFMEDLVKHYQKEDKNTKKCTRRMFFKYLFDPDKNCIMKPANVEMNQTEHPLCDYWIDSSHNTYLTGDQYSSNSSTEQYRKALLRGCRCVELDVWDGDKVPIVYHGFTLTSKVPFWDCMEAVCEAAFITSEYPIILSLEVHCQVDGKKMMAKIVRHILDQVQKFVDGSDNPLWEDPVWSSEKEYKPLTPKGLKGKILIKTAGYLEKEDPDSKKAEEEEFKDGCRKNVIDQYGRVLGPIKYQYMMYQLKAKETKNPNAKKEDNSNLLEKCAHIPTKKSMDAKGREWDVHSIEENTAMGLISNPKSISLIDYNKKSLSRIYPKGMRVDSSNYNPIPFWANGCQIVALNYHRPGYPMWLNEGKFMRSGRSGYVLKPDWMREIKKKEGEKEGKKEVEEEEGKVIQEKKKKELTLNVVVISGWRLPRPWGIDKISSNTTDEISIPEVIVSLWTSEGIITDYKLRKNSMMPDNETLRDLTKKYPADGLKDGHNPIWFKENEVKSFKIEQKEIDMLVFEVRDSMVKEVDKNKTIGYYAITVSDIREGIRVVPLKGEDGAPLISGELIVWVEKKEEDSKKASA